MSRSLDAQYEIGESKPYDPDIHGPVDAYLYRTNPRRYASIAEMVDLAMRLDARPCTGNGCDEDRCPRHERTTQVVDRYLRLRAREEARRRGELLSPSSPPRDCGKGGG